MCPSITPFKFTNHSKVELIQRLTVAVERKKNRVRAHRMSTSGQITYSAPDGCHDDCVIALPLANKYRQEYAQTVTRPEFLRCQEEVHEQPFPLATLCGIAGEFITIQGELQNPGAATGH